MKRLVLAVSVLLLAFGLVWLAARDPGYVLIARAPWSFETSLVVFGIILAGILAASYFLVRLITRTLKIPTDVADWRSRRNSRAARNALNDGLFLLASCEWEKAESQLLSGQRFSDAPMLNYLGAAVAAQGRGDLRKRDDYLAEAGRVAPEDNLATGMTQAFLQHLANQQEQALATLTGLRNDAPDNVAALKLLKDTYLELNDWTGIMNLLPELGKKDVLPGEEYASLEIDTYKALLTLSLPSGSLEVLQTAWNKVPKHLQQHPQLIAIYARKLIEQDEHDTAEKLLRKAIESEWNSQLARLYGDAASQHIGRQLETARSWYVARPKDPDLLIGLARLALENGETEAAREYLQTSIGIRPDPLAWYHLGRCYEREGNAEEAMSAYRRGVLLRRTDR